MTLQALRQALSDPAIYPEPTSMVEIHETHISLVFLTDQYAYKIKKPVELGFVDYSTLETRRTLCHQEVTLNRRLSTDVYLDIVALHQDGPHYRACHIRFNATQPIEPCIEQALAAIQQGRAEYDRD